MLCSLLLYKLEVCSDGKLGPTSMSSLVDAFGTKISTRIRQAGFDPLGLESLMYLGEQCVIMYSHAFKKSSWANITWFNLLCRECTGDKGGREFVFDINGLQAQSMNTMDYLCALGLEVTFPKVTLTNTASPVPYYVYFSSNTTEDVETIIEQGQSLFWYLSDGTSGLPPGQLIIGTEAFLTGNTQLGGLGLQAECVHPLINYSHRHRVAWGHHAILAAIKEIAFEVGGVPYERKSHHAILSDYQNRMRNGIYSVAGLEATSLDAHYEYAGIGKECERVLFECETDRSRALILPHSFTISAFADRGENGKWKSAYPVLLSCVIPLQERVTLLNDLRRILVLEEEQLPYYGDSPVIFGALPSEITVDTVPTLNMHISNGCKVWTVPVGGFVLQSGTFSGYMTTGTYTVNGITYTSNVPFKLACLGANHLECTGCFYPLTRPHDCHRSSFAKEIDYGCWIKEKCLEPRLHMKAFGAMVTQLERGMTKKDCRNKTYLYERYVDFCDYVDAGCKFQQQDMWSVPGQTKWAYTLAQNVNSYLQGHFFNYTNSTHYDVITDKDLCLRRFIFCGKNSIGCIGTTIQNFRDENHTSTFMRYVSGPLFSQRAPLDHGYNIAPIYANWINSIYPDGSINADFTIPYLNIFTESSARLDFKLHEYHGKCDTERYNIIVIFVAWNALLFELIPPGPPLPMPMMGQPPQQQRPYNGKNAQMASNA